LFAEGGLKTSEEGLWNQLWAATSKDVVSGLCYELVGIVRKRTLKSKDEKLREGLWEWTAVQLQDYTVYFEKLEDILHVSILRSNIAAGTEQIIHDSKITVDSFL
jgi:hypothetical protein